LEDRKGAGDLRSFRFDRTGPFGVLTFDVPGSRVNLLGQAALNELEWVGEWLPQSGLQGLVVRSAKATGFCAGADLTEIQGLAPRMGVFASKEALRLHFAPFTRAFRKLETGGVPVASVIDGAAMGGGLELALATHARFVTDSTNTRLSLPEFSVGLFPAGGGSQRLPRLIGIEAALPVLTAERMLTAQEAADVGLASLCASAQEAFDAALAWLSTRPGARQPWDRQETDPVGVGMDAGNRIELDALVTLLSRGEPWAIMRLRFRGQRAWQAACRQGATSGIEAVRDAVADLGAGPWSHERLHAAADVAERAAVGLSADERAAADVLVVDDLAVPETIGGLLARGEGLP
jgi:3-hydroxyacyl-CoA dehydrogenase/enoyl-CoA hydratase/3-hydroxybutyryl-CoA epimerase